MKKLEVSRVNHSKVNLFYFKPLDTVNSTLDFIEKGTIVLPFDLSRNNLVEKGLVIMLILK